MYDGFGPGHAESGEPGGDGSAVFNISTHRMSLYDVGMASLVCMELQALATLAITAFEPPRQADHDLLMARYTELSQLLTAHLWDDQSGLFVNRHWNGTFFRRFSPTSFYPMLAGLATEEQARTMMHTLTSPDGFCVSQTGAGLRPECVWPIPSISASDSAFPALGYWRGYVVSVVIPFLIVLSSGAALVLRFPCSDCSLCLRHPAVGASDPARVLGPEQSALHERERGDGRAQSACGTGWGA
eukprot:SAG22_NODE_44_length_24912_cov_33.648894_15_plen_243_part_00